MGNRFTNISVILIFGIVIGLLVAFVNPIMAVGTSMSVVFLLMSKVDKRLRLAGLAFFLYFDILIPIANFDFIFRPIYLAASLFWGYLVLEKLVEKNISAKGSATFFSYLLLNAYILFNIMLISPDRVTSLKFFMYFVIMNFIMLSVSQTANNREKIDFLYNVLIKFAIIFFSYGILQLVVYLVFKTPILAIDEGQKFFLTRFSRPSAFFDEPDLLGDYSMFIITILLPIFILNKKQLSKTMIGAAFVSVLVLFASQRRAAWIGLIISIAMYFFLYGSKRIKWSRVTIVMIVFVILVSMAFIFQYNYMINIVNRIIALTDVSTTVGSVGSGLYRIQVHDYMMSQLVSLKDYMFGKGFGSLKYFTRVTANKSYFHKTLSQLGSKGFFIQSNMLFNLGVIGTGIFIAVLLIFFFKHYLAIRRYRNDFGKEFYFQFYIACFAHFIAQIAVSFIADQTLTVLFWFNLGLLVALNREVLKAVKEVQMKEKCTLSLNSSSSIPVE